MSFASTDDLLLASRQTKRQRAGPSRKCRACSLLTPFLRGLRISFRTGGIPLNRVDDDITIDEIKNYIKCAAKPRILVEGQLTKRLIK